MPAQSGGLALDPSGNLYGTTKAGGTRSGGGTVFEFDGRALTTIYNFCPHVGCLDGENPTSGVLLDASGNLYGTTSSGGKSHYAGTAYRLTR